MRASPDYIVIGAGKCGTTSLHSYLSAHPLVCPPTVKEIRYFAIHYERGPSWYRAHFPTRVRLAATGHGRRALTGEASPYYLFHPAVPERVAGALPRVKLIVVLRNPVDRAISDYHHMVKHGMERRSIEAAIGADLDRSSDEPTSEYDTEFGTPRLHSYVRRGHYAEQLTRWYRVFGRPQLLVLETSKLSRAGAHGFEQVLEFLALPPWKPREFTERLVGSYPTAPPDLRAELARHYAPYNEALWELLGVDWGWNNASVSAP